MELSNFEIKLRNNIENDESYLTKDPVYGKLNCLEHFQIEGFCYSYSAKYTRKIFRDNARPGLDGEENHFGNLIKILKEKIENRTMTEEVYNQILAGKYLPIYNYLTKSGKKEFSRV